MRTTIHLDANDRAFVSNAVAISHARRLALCPLAAIDDDTRPHAMTMFATARDDLAAALGSASARDRLTFTDGAADAVSILVRAFSKVDRSSLACLSVDHPSVREPVAGKAGFAVLPVGPDGRVLLASAVSLAGDATMARRRLLVCIQAANGETGVVQPVAELLSALAAYRDNVFVLVDGSQALGRIPVSLDGIDAFVFGGATLHEPQGTGFAYVSERLGRLLWPQGEPAPEERDDALHHAAALGAMAEAVRIRHSAFEAHTAHMSALRDSFEARLREAVEGVRFVGAEAERLPNTSCVLFPQSDAATLRAELEDRGIVAAPAPPRADHDSEALPVLNAMGLSDGEARRCLSFAFSVDSVPQDVETAVAEITALATRHE